MTNFADEIAAANEANKAQKAKPAVEVVLMDNGTKREFVGKRRLLKDTEVDEAGVERQEGQITVADGALKVTLSFRNGQTRVFRCPASLIIRAAVHGLEQKLGDETAGMTEVEDMVLSTEDLIARLEKGEWNVTRESTGYAGASIVVRAIMEASGKSQQEVKDFLARKLEQNPSLTRAALYASFRNPQSKTGQIIRRLEEEKLAKSSAVDADDVLGEI